MAAKLSHVCRQILRASKFHNLTALHPNCKDAAECTGSLHPNTASRNRTLHVSELYTESVTPHTGPAALLSNVATAVVQPTNSGSSQKVQWDTMRTRNTIRIILVTTLSMFQYSSRNLSQLTRVQQF